MVFRSQKMTGEQQGKAIGEQDGEYFQAQLQAGQGEILHADKAGGAEHGDEHARQRQHVIELGALSGQVKLSGIEDQQADQQAASEDRKSTRLNSSHVKI